MFYQASDTNPFCIIIFYYSIIFGIFYNQLTCIKTEINAINKNIELIIMEGFL